MNNNENIYFSIPKLSLNIRQLNMDSDKLYRDIHYHNEIEIIRVDEGELLCHIDNNIITVPKGKLVFINSRVIHKLSYHTKSAACTYMQIDITKYAKVLIPIFNNPLYLFMNADNILKYNIYDIKSEIGQIFEDIESESNNKNDYYDIYIKSKIFNIIAFMCRHSFSPQNVNCINADISPKIVSAIDYVEKNYSSKIHLDNICNKLNINKYYFCKLFKKTTSAKFTDYINYRRLIHAENMLAESEDSITEIAFSSGFTSIQYFNKIFNKYKGCSPRTFRRLHRRSN